MGVRTSSNWGSGERVEYQGTSPITGFPFVLCCWVDPGASGDGVFELSKNGSVTNVVLRANGGSTEWRATARFNGYTETSKFGGSSSIPAGMNFAGFRMSSSELDLFFDNQYTGSPTSHSRTFTTVDEHYIGDSSYGYFDGDGAWFQIYDADMTQDQMNDIQYNPYAHPKNLVWSVSALESASAATDFKDTSNEDLDPDQGQAVGAGTAQSRVHLYGGG